MLIVCGCSKDPIIEEAELSDRIVRVIFNPNGLGDLSYNDHILKGILEKQEEEGFRLQYLSPGNDEEGIDIIRKWQQDPAISKQYIILVGNQLWRVANQVLPSSLSQDYLLCDMDISASTVPVFRFCGYGVSFLSGVSAFTVTQSDSAVFLGGRPNENYMEDSYLGFRDGFLYAGGKTVREMYIADDDTGFSNPVRGYQLADSLFRHYPFIYAMAGVSNTGIYKYLRERPSQGCYTAGVDADQSAYSTHIIGSMIKDAGKCTGDCIVSWLKGEELPLRRYFDLSSGYTYFKVAELYRDQLDKVINENFKVATEREAEYVRKYR